MEAYDLELESGRSVRLRVAPAGCNHLDQIHDLTRSSGGEECLKVGDDWVHLRVCLPAATSGAADNSKNRHATGHHHETGDAVIPSAEPGEDWVYCYFDHVFVEPVK